MLTIGRWLAMPQAIADAPWQVPVRQAAAQILAARHARVIKRGRQLTRKSPEQLHRLRIAVKKLRYAVEFFNDLFQVKAMAVQRARLEKLQDILGCINDAVALESLFATASNNARRWPVAAADAVMRQHQQLALQQRKRLASAWRRYRAAAQPWTKSQGR
jgi:CHAD domain-containing protein